MSDFPVTVVSVVLLLCFCFFSLKVMAIKAGNRKVLNKLIGLVQRETQGRSSPVLVKQLLEKKLSE